MATKKPTPYKKGGAVKSKSAKKAPPTAKKAPLFGGGKKPKIPALGGAGLMGLGGTGAQGLRP
jgi:hypothetical protein